MISVDRCLSPYFAFKLCKFQQNLWLITPYPWARLFELMVLPLCYIIMCNEVSKHFLEKPHKYLWGALDGGDHVALLISPCSWYTCFDFFVLFGQSKLKSLFSLSWFGLSSFGHKRSKSISQVSIKHLLVSLFKFI